MDRINFLKIIFFYTSLYFLTFNKEKNTVFHSAIFNLTIFKFHNFTHMMWKWDTELYRNTCFQNTFIYMHSVYRTWLSIKGQSVIIVNWFRQKFYFSWIPFLLLWKVLGKVYLYIWIITDYWCEGDYFLEFTSILYMYLTRSSLSLSNVYYFKHVYSYALGIVEI